MLTLAQRQESYAYHRDNAGMTVEEFERAHGLPPFSIVPSARRARGPEADGWLIYDPETRAEALAEEARQIACLRALDIPQETIAWLYDSGPPRVRHRGESLSSRNREGAARRRAAREEAYRQMACLRALGLRLKDVAALYGSSSVHVWRKTRGLM